MSKRLFIAFKIPSDLKNELLLVQHKIKNNLDLKGVNWVKPDNMHITIAFLGQIDEKSVPQIVNIMDSANFNPVQVKGEGLKFFNKNNYPAIFFYSLEITDELKDTVGRIRETLIKNGIDFDRKNFNAHVTIARIKDEFEGKLLFKFVNQKKTFFESKRYSINSLVLFESRFIDNQPTYISLHEINKEV
ncbi:MAG: 2'-5' RNA ligase [candidate division TA06 bacterium 32_111]|uniref:RNA 2',3'-cyclic phosphodiesterase n=2 Tax=Bacteria candidate phyla TaxID=1783234 RepID=A0A117M6W5_UNCT6|nr:MAG: 2'-5' RNA ligase [candidate division TA06 bacterium 32_111]KUK87654.1 MAG: 2'-5' RNA ligase [candidate division TA06 bacterium 34_109]HAF07493.1 RNA 2',3'-cyclic phosphodiesterase [candidate division WOR-3 bacterium]HCP17562.1 RNA 2',3'-cyclic phosphodiesterase [candidate division WOR-3 bacterium]